MNQFIFRSFFIVKEGRVIIKTALLLFSEALPFNDGAELVMKYPTVTNFGGVTSQIDCLLEMLLELVNSRMMMRLSVLIAPLRVYS